MRAIPGAIAIPTRIAAPATLCNASSATTAFGTALRPSARKTSGPDNGTPEGGPSTPSSQPGPCSDTTNYRFSGSRICPEGSVTTASWSITRLPYPQRARWSIQDGARGAARAGLRQQGADVCLEVVQALGVDHSEEHGNLERLDVGIGFLGEGADDDPLA